MKFLLDTNAVIAVLKRQEKLITRLRQHEPTDCAISSIVVHELFYGAYKSQRKQENLARVEALEFEILDFDAEDARCSAELRAALSEAGTPIGPYDVLIAGQALARSLTLISRNLREFRRVSALHVEDWET